MKDEEPRECTWDDFHNNYTKTLSRVEMAKYVCSTLFNESSPSACDYDHDYWDMVRFNYCQINNHQWFTWILIVILIVLCFYFLSTTSGDYFAEVLGIVSEKIGLSQNLAGLTLLALGNAAPDVIVAVITGEGGDEGVTNSLSSLLGGGIFVFGFVSSFVIFYGKQIKVLWINFVRDVGVYFVTMMFIFIIGVSYKKYNIVCSIIPFIIYVLYVSSCVIMERIEKKKLGKKEDEDLEGEDFKVKMIYDEDETVGEDENKQFQMSKISEKVEEENKDETTIFGNKDEVIEEKLKDNNDDTDKKEEKPKKQKTKKLIEQTVDYSDIQSYEVNSPKNKKLEENMEIPVIDEASNEQQGVKKRKKKPKFDISDLVEKSYYYRKSLTVKEGRVTRFEKDKMIYNKFLYEVYRNILFKGFDSDWREKSIPGKILYFVVDFPLNLIRSVTIPPFCDEKYNRAYFVVQPIFIPFMISATTGLLKYYTHKVGKFVFIGIYSAAIILVVIFIRFSYKTQIPSCHAVLYILAMGMSVLWLFAATNVLVQMIKDARMLLPFNIPSNFLTMTVLSLGNSVPDFFVNCSLAKQGYGVMALSGCVGAPVFALLVGFSISMIKKSIKDKKEGNPVAEFNLLNGSLESIIILIVLGGLLLSSAHLIIGGAICKYRFKRIPNSIIGWCIFGTYFIGIIITTIAYKK